ncbi:hypothetical protein ACFFRR_002230 [Megaselia abdita]
MLCLSDCYACLLFFCRCREIDCAGYVFRQPASSTAQKNPIVCPLVWLCRLVVSLSITPIEPSQTASQPTLPILVPLFFLLRSSVRPFRAALLYFTAFLLSSQLIFCCLLAGCGYCDSFYLFFYCSNSNTLQTFL